MKGISTAALVVASAWPAFATLELPDQLDVGGGGLGPMVASFEAITNEVGYVVDDTFDGEITFKWTMKWNTLEGGTAYKSWSLFQFFDDPGDEPIDLKHESIGIGTEWVSAQVSTYREPGGYALGRESLITVRTGTEYAFTLVVDYHAGAPDTAVVTGGGFVNQPLAPGDWSFHHVRARVGNDGEGRTSVDFTNMSITSGGIGGIRGAGQVDPPFPADRPVVSEREWSRWPRKRIRQLEAERDRLLEKISVLPWHEPLFLSSQLGYHSRFEESGSDDPASPHQINFQFRWAPTLEAIALAPAFNPKEPGAYAFPKRFKIEVLDSQSGKFEEVVNWLGEDFPDPGPYPVFFSRINRSVTQVRITVPPGMQESGVAYFAIGEVYLFQRALDAQIGDNMAVWGPTGIEVTASDSFSMPPLWDVEYLYDGSVGFGFPLSDQTVESEDLLVAYEDTADFSDRVQITLDLGRVEEIGRVEFWPAGAPYLLALPSLGFPRDISLELSADPDFRTPKVLNVEEASGYKHRENLLSVMGNAYPAQYIRITMEGLSEYKGKRVLGLGEISVSEYGRVLSANCKVTAEGIPEEYREQLPLLVDGCSRQRLIMPEGEWIKGLAQRRPLDRRLAVVEEELALARASWQKIKWRSTVWGGSAVFVGLVGWLAVQRRIRKQGIEKLKWRITRDLHDEVGSSLGSIALASKRMERTVPHEDVKEGLSELSLLAREAAVSLREVVWVIDQGTIRLPDLIQKLVERAERVLHGMELSSELPSDCPDLVVPLTFKRHLIMFFREAIYNCARHANATKVQVFVTTGNGKLCLRISDNGCGFDRDKLQEGWGLDSMDKRAKEMGGSMELISQPDQGTAVQLTVPLSTLQDDTDHYKTSN